ncbi:Hybrid signal transduction histidine kinase K [Hyphodiscus hymeniophilus]|uniref:Hybrid signal transduction histidine kinase K n=1 Tax=Hyphodiscus hymeniophilus TaxID=353542 RepID=A0A9P6VQ42_9HELO|nr:Hybrid signal transduction histidine kinase K [Hyphodiscus hymeniophilus]
MTQETRSIFTSQKDFTSQISNKGESTHPASALLPTSAPSFNESLDGDANTQQQDELIAVQDKEEANLKTLRRPSFNEALQGRTRAQSSREPRRPHSITLPSVTTSKHQREENGIGKATPSSEPPLKKSRSKLRRDKFTINKTTSGFSQKPSQPPSPLFFSHSPRPPQRPILLSSLSSAEAAAMLNKAKDESAGGITTLKLARGSMSQNATSSPRSGSSRASIERNSTPRSPDTRGKQTGLQLLQNIGIIELLEQDDRPQFIVDVANSGNFTPGGPLQIIYANASLRAYQSILELVTGKPDFISGDVLGANIKSPLSNGVWDSSSILAERSRAQSLNILARTPVITESSEPTDYFGDAPNQTPSNTGESPLPLSSPADSIISPPRETINAAQSDGLTTEMLNTRYPDGSSFDWTRLPITPALPRHIQFARSIDWASTPLGPIETWAFDLRAMCNLIMGSPHPAAMYWGPEFIAIYNEAYILLAGNKHPTLMGMSYKEAWKEIWPSIEGIFNSAVNYGQATMKDDDCLFLKRNGFLEETYFSWSIIPLVGEDGSVVGLYNPAFEKTRRKIAERRMLTLREVGEKTAAARQVKVFWGEVIKGLEYNEYDVPFVFLYSVSEDVDSEMSSIHSGSLSAAPQCVLEGTLGVPVGHKAAVSPLDLKTSDDGFAPYLRESMKTDRPVLLTVEAGTLSWDLIDGLEWRGSGDPCGAAVVCPIHPTTGESILGFLVMGINPRRPYDDDYSLFIQVLSRQLATSMASAMLFEEEIRRGQKAARLAALDRQELSKQLDLRTQEAVESETKFTRMAEFAPVGMFIADSSGEITYSNDTWWEISRHPRSEHSASLWMESVMEEDQEGVREIWNTVMEGTPVTHEFRFKTPWNDKNGNRGETWVLMSAYPEKYSDGKLKSVFGSITNISAIKWAKNFDEINNSLSEYRLSDEMAKASDKISDLFDSGIDAAQTISLCAQHQKRIVDDILTLSKLDSALLVVTPVAVQPVAVVQRALKMFEGELDTNDIAMEFRMEKSYLDMDIDWVKLDPSRLLQVLINLTTNAIKFTNGQEKRTIIVSIGASRERPSGLDSDVSYFQSRSKKSETTDDPEWGTGENLFLKFAVQDTGRGLDESERTLLFQRFRQASPRTHVQYGGSGLGLFISRELTELQGGEIGVSSERGVGSTFAFYIKARRIDDMPADTPVSTSLKHLRHTSSSGTSVTIESRRNSSGKPVHRSTTTGKRRPSAIVSSNSAILPNASILDYSKTKVLIVEDNLVNQRVLQKQLRNAGFVVDVANHGGEALDVLRGSRFWAGKEKTGADLAIILMDLEMPVMDGLTCARTIRDLETDGTIVRHVPIIAVTANARLEQIESAMAAGMDDVVSKPFRIPELIPKITELVSKSKASPSGSRISQPLASSS